jgi:hypothetical protein
MRHLLAATLLCSLSIACDNVRTVDLPTPAASVSAWKSMPAAGAAISITSPKDGSTVARRTEVTVRVTGFDLVPAKNDEPKPGEGHIMFYSGESFEAPVVPDRAATSGGQGTFTAAPTSETAYVWGPLTAGEWMFAAQLVGHDGAPLSPPRVTSVRVKVAG